MVKGCKKCGGIMNWNSYFHAYVCEKCGEFVHSRTNFERLAGMSTERLAQFIAEQVLEWQECPSTMDHSFDCEQYKNCKECWEAWLNAESLE